MKLSPSNKIIKILKIGSFAAIILAYLSRLLGAFVDPDMWWHIRLGEDILKGTWVNTLTYTCTDYIWINHSWLSDVLISIVNKILGFQGLSILFALVFSGGIAFSVLSLNLILNNHKIKSSKLNILLYVAFFTLILSSFIAIRPQIFTFLFFNALIFFLLKIYYSKSIKYVTLLPAFLVFILWVNLHGGFVIGIVLIGIFIIDLFGGFLFKLLSGQKSQAKLNLNKIKYLVLLVVLFLLASLINPFGFDLWKEIFTLVLGSNNANFITEWKAINIKESYGLFYFVLFIVSLVLPIINKSRNTLRLLLVLIFGFLSLYSVRYILPVSGIILLVLFVEANLMFDWLLNRILVKDKDILRLLSLLKYVLITSVALIGIMSAYIGFAFFLSVRDVNSIENFFYPLDAKNYLEENKDMYKNLNFYNTYVWGGYLEYTLPEYKWIIDGRMPEWHCKGEVKSSIMLDYIEVEDLGKDWNLVFEKHNTGGILIKTGSILYNVLESSSKWDIVYSDKLATIFIRK